MSPGILVVPVDGRDCEGHRCEGTWGFMNRLTRALGFSAALCASPALADDSAATLATGNLVLVRNDAVEMRNTDLIPQRDPSELILETMGGVRAVACRRLGFPGNPASPVAGERMRNLDPLVPGPGLEPGRPTVSRF